MKSCALCVMGCVSVWLTNKFANRVSQQQWFSKRL
ncbi:hypothetical protein BPC006_II0579 [Burkholderia pseudomallei BPC006]|nr:hypothetical protein BPC006_II0579 [Burkholderia pseudomallei BPC006]